MGKTDKYFKMAMQVRPNQWSMLVGFVFMVYGAVGTLAGITVTPGLEVPIFYSGLVLFMLGLGMAFYRGVKTGGK